jgi:hypothetical protein
MRNISIDAADDSSAQSEDTVHALHSDT